MTVRVTNRFGTFLVRNPKVIETARHGDALHGIYRPECDKEWMGIGLFPIAEARIETVYGQPELSEAVA